MYPFSPLHAWRREGRDAGTIGKDGGDPRLGLLLYAGTGDPFWRAVAAASSPPGPESPAEEAPDLPGWGLPQAEAAFALLANATPGDRGGSPRGARKLLAAIRSSPAPSDYFSEKAEAEIVESSGAPEPRAMAALALLALFDETGDPAARSEGLRLAGELAQAMGGPSVSWVGFAGPSGRDLPFRTSGSPRSGYRAQALAVHAWLAAARCRPGPEAGLVARVRRRILAEGWDGSRGGFAPLLFRPGTRAREPVIVRDAFELDDQYWALAAFAPVQFPYGQARRHFR